MDHTDTPTAEPAPTKVARPDALVVPREVAANPDYVEWDEPLRRRLESAKEVGVRRSPAPTIPPEQPPEPPAAKAAPAPGAAPDPVPPEASPLVGPPMMLETPPGVQRSALSEPPNIPNPPQPLSITPAPSDPPSPVFRATGSSGPPSHQGVGRAPPLRSDPQRSESLGVRVVATPEPPAARPRSSARPDRIKPAEFGVLLVFVLTLLAAIAGVLWFRQASLVEAPPLGGAVGAQVPAVAPPPAPSLELPAPEPPAAQVPSDDPNAEHKPKVPVRTTLNNDPIEMLKERERAQKAAKATPPPP